MDQIQAARTKEADHMEGQMCLSMGANKIQVLNMEAVTYHSTEQLKTRVDLDKARHRKHTHPIVKVMLP
jgi:hypothetical protein